MNILVTPDGQPVFWDGKGNFSLEKNDDFCTVACRLSGLREGIEFLAKLFRFQHLNPNGLES
jgi:hypothetical protein